MIVRSVLGLCVLVALLVSAKADLTDDVMARMPDDFRREYLYQKKLTVVDLIEKNGYPCETHQVTTEDGYILTVYRIPHNRNNDTITRGAVFVMHGLLSSAADWVVLGPHQGLPYLLSDQGYDVWLGNARGNTLSRNHTTLSVKSGEFWKFSWNEIGYYDLPAMIDYVLETTGEEKLSYVGHSQGSTSFFVMTSSRPEYNDKIKSMHALAPVAYMAHMRSPLIRLMVPFASSADWMLEAIGLHEFLPSTKILVNLAAQICKDGSHFQPICTNTLFLLCGFNPSQLNATTLPAILAHVPAGASTKQLIHYGQLVASAKFRKYDYGLIRNLQKYGWGTPPAYDLKKVTAPVALHYSDNDWMAHSKDVNTLSKQLGNVIGKFRVPDGKFNHLDYLWGIDSVDLVYKKVISLMNRFGEN